MAQSYPVSESLQRLQELRDRFDATPVAARLDFLLALKGGSCKRLADYAGPLDVPYRTLRRWWKLYRDEGLTGLLGNRYDSLGSSGIEPNRYELEQPISSDIIEFLNSLPDHSDPIAWMKQFRSSLLRMFNDIDRISVNVNLDARARCNGDTRTMITQHLQGDHAASRRPVIEVTRNVTRQSEAVVRSMAAQGFPVLEYHPPHLLDYWTSSGAPTGSIVLWRRIGSAPISHGTIATFEALRPFFSSMFGDCRARYRSADLQPRTFTGRLSEIVAEARLSDREREVMVHYLAGSSYKEIAERLGIALSTARKHIDSIHQKTGVHTTNELYALFFAPMLQFATEGRD